MYRQEHKIAQAEHAAFLERFYRTPLEGITVRVPNIFDRMVARLKSAFAGRQSQPAQRKTATIHGAPAK